MSGVHQWVRVLERPGTNGGAREAAKNDLVNSKHGRKLTRSPGRGEGEGGVRAPLPRSPLLSSSNFDEIGWEKRGREIGGCKY